MCKLKVNNIGSTCIHEAYCNVLQALSQLLRKHVQCRCTYMHVYVQYACIHVSTGIHVRK